ncbi:hypothetical protein PpBr36_03942 [Pyricularia pennisetigena]|uniref:hypothetical protein n=1 Tax=Pyricularia pennisetigena TaxID=1578925 RepID=UPI001152A7DE|nr:hypothetical protein PpBr36_03942 [Pyricularia pennisetigena]TLS29944.1 hypothetical protein PpBr36_03942 [Pyricularia pennisetigena]
MRYSIFILCAAAVHQAAAVPQATAVPQVAAVRVPAYLYLGELFSPKELFFYGQIATRRTTEGKPDRMNYHPDDIKINQLYMSTSRKSSTAAIHMLRNYPQKEVEGERYVYAINTKNIEASFVSVSSWYAQQNKQNPYPDEDEWLAIHDIKEKQIDGWYILNENGVDVWVDKKDYVNQRDEALARVAREKKKHSKSRCLFRRC